MIRWGRNLWVGNVRIIKGGEMRKLRQQLRGEGKLLEHIDFARN